MSGTATSAKTKVDVKDVGARVRSLAEDGRLDEAIDMIQAMLNALQTQNSELALRLMRLQREQAGRRGERIDPAQLSLMLELLGEAASTDEDRAATEAEDARLNAERAALDAPPADRQTPRRRRPSKALPRTVITHELPPEERTCPRCETPMPKIGEDVSELVELVPAHFLVEEHRRAKYACRTCKETVVTAPGPDKVVEKGLAGPGLLAHVVTSKFEQHLPLTRLVEIYRRGGLETSVSTLCGWVDATARELRPIVDRIADRLFHSTLLQTDGSGIKVLDRDDPEGIRRGTMWCSVGDRRYVLFRYTRDGTGEEGPWKHLAGREGYLQADAANIFDRLYDGQRARAIEVGCWAHARRKLHELVEVDLRVAYPLKLIAQLYRIEDLADRRGASPPDRLKLRRERSQAIIDRYQRWVADTASREPPASNLAKACAYSANHWEALTRFLQDGILPLDNSRCEQQIRSLALGRRNFLFAGSDAGAENAATLYSLLRTCALHDVDSYAYLVDVLRKIASGWPQHRIDELLPENWSPPAPAVTGTDQPTD
jgi:transposase